MNFKIYIQAMNNFPIEDWAVSAYMGFKARQANIILFEDIAEVPVSRTNIVVAFIEETVQYFNRLGVEQPPALNIPDSLRKYAGRWIVNSTMAGARNGTVFPFFIKPERVKQFIPGVVRNQVTFDQYFQEIPDDTRVIISEVVDLVAEYRGYVIDGKLVGLKHYLGDFCVFPDTEVIKAAIRDYKDAPAGYSIDFGVTSDGRTLLIECNDGWSLGNYGLDHGSYATLLSKRWLEILKHNPVEAMAIA